MMQLLRAVASRVWRFGSFELNQETAELRISGTEVKLPLQPARLLALLVAHAGELVTREQIRREIWGQTTVNFDLGLNFCLNRIRVALGDDPRSPRYIETLPRRGYRFIAPVEQVPPPNPTLAVLPFGNLSHDPEQDLLGDAVADMLTTELGSVSTLRVISRQSVLHLKGTEKTAPEIAQELKVDALVEGSVLRAGDRIRITAQLVQASPEQHLWAKSYDCDLTDILTLQGKIAQAISGAVRLALTPAEVARLSRPRPVDPEVHVAYIKGRHHMGRWSGESLEKALEYFDLAVQRDPGHALSYACAADCYALLGFWGYRPFRDAYQKAKERALTAIALDDTLSAAHWALAWAMWFLDWDLAACEKQNLRAIELNPSDELSRHQRSIFLATTTDDCAGAIREIRLALDLDPLSQYVNLNAAWIYLFVKEYEGAIDQARKTLELFPGALQAYWIIGLAEMCRTRYGAAVGALEQALATSRDAFSIAYLGSVLARAGQVELARSMLRDVLTMSERQPVPPSWFVHFYAQLGERDQAFEWMEKAYGARDPGLFFMRVIPLYDSLRSDPRFDEMLRRIGIPSNRPAIS